MAGSKTARDTAVSTFCVDATNLVRRAYGYGGPAFSAQEDSDARELVMGLARLCEDNPERLEIDVIFDGPGSYGVAAPALPNMRVRFAREDEADALILDRVRALRHEARKVTVVTADSELASQVREEGGKWLEMRSGSGLSSIVQAIGRQTR